MSIKHKEVRVDLGRLEIRSYHMHIRHIRFICRVIFIVCCIPAKTRKCSLVNKLDPVRSDAKLLDVCPTSQCRWIVVRDVHSEQVFLELVVHECIQRQDTRMADSLQYPQRLAFHLSRRDNLAEIFKCTFVVFAIQCTCCVGDLVSELLRNRVVNYSLPTKPKIRN